jgi:cytochrome b
MTDATDRRFVWDLPTRIFHWSIVVLIGFSWWSAETHRMEWHYRSGLTICMLILFRLAWGVMGTDTARFSQFVKGPRAILEYLRPKEGAPRIAPLGHNPLGGWSVIAMIVLICLQVSAGLFAVDVDGLESGPLSFLVDFDQGRQAAEFHETIFNVLLAITAIHIVAVFFYLIVKRRNLIRPMVTGFDLVPDDELPSGARKVPVWRLVAAIAVALAVTYAIWKGFWLN